MLQYQHRDPCSWLGLEPDELASELEKLKPPTQISGLGFEFEDPSKIPDEVSDVPYVYQVGQSHQLYKYLLSIPIVRNQHYNDCNSVHE